jgi:hypothetical protein
MITNIKKNKDDVKPYGHVAAVIKTEWGYVFNTKQYPS